MNTRRTVLRSAAWAVPAVTIATAAPAFATSHVDPPVITDPTVATVFKCPGQSEKDDPWTYGFVFAFDRVPTNVQGNALTVNGETFTIKSAIPHPDNPLEMIFYTTPSTNSANASGTGSISYTTDGVVKSAAFSYKGTPPNHVLCSIT